VAFLDTKKTTASGSGSSTGSAASSTTPDDKDKKSDKTDTKEVASTDKSGTKNEPVKKMYCN
jgi:hypothetical protein